MKNNNNAFETTPIHKNIHGLFYIILIQFFAAALWLLLIPKEPENAVFLGYSLKRLALLIPMVFPTFAVLFANHKLKKSKTRRKWLEKEGNKAILAMMLILGGVLTALAVWSFIFLYHFLGLFNDVGFYNRLMPLLISYLFVGIELPAFVITAFYRVHNEHRKPCQFPWKSFFAALLVIGLCFLVIEVTGWGYGFTRIVIVSLGVPLLEGQIWYITGILLIIAFAALAWNAIPSGQRPHLTKHRDAAVFLVLWLIAVVLWASLPLPDHNYFAPSARQPNFEKYPFSDAEQYDCNSLYVLYGTAKNFVISKPFYVSFLTVLHAVAGLDYVRVIFLQTLVIALFPGILYLIGKELQSRLGGIAIALLAIFREINSIQASTMANVSNSKLLLSGMLATLLASLLVYVIIRWFKASGKRVSEHAFIIGGIIGAFILTRLQAMALVPFGILLVVVRYFKNIKSILISILLLVLAVGLVLAPVLIRNRAITGVYWVDNPSSTGGLYRYFIIEDDYEIEIPEADTMEEQLKRNISVISLAFSRGFGNIMQFMMDHFMRNEISSMLIMPVRLGNQIHFLDFLKINQPFWAETYTQLNALNLLVLITNSIIIALGFSYAFQRNPGAVLCIIGFHVIYSLSSAVVRLAGWRFILPADWIIFAFYALGLVELITVFFQAAFKWDLKTLASDWVAYPTEPVTKSVTRRGYLIYGLLFLIIGGFIPLREALFPSLIPEFNKADVCTEVKEFIEESYYSDLSESINEFCTEDDTIVLKGFGFYPRFFDKGEGYYDRPHDRYYGKQDYSRIVFRLVGQQNGEFYIRTTNPNVNFTNGSLVYVVSSPDSKGGAQMVIISTEDPQVIISAPILAGDETFFLNE
jgi:hypothetical protein